MKFLVETSARHVHVTKEDLETLFGKGYALTKKKDLSQPGQFAAQERVAVAGPRGELANVRVLGPVRGRSQVELTFSEAKKLGIPGQVRMSGDVDNTPGCTLKGPAGEVAIEKGVIAAKRHIHFNPQEAQEAGVADKQIVSVKVDYNGRALVFGDVVCRVSPNYALAMHVDTDESNAAALPGTVDGQIIL